MKRLFYYASVVLSLLMFAFGTTACGGDDDDVPENFQQMTEGVHRIEVTIDGDTSGWNIDVAFVATYGNSAGVKLYENNEVVSESGGFMCGEMRNYTIETERKCNLMSLSLTLSHKQGVSVNPLKVRLKSYVNDMPIKDVTSDFPVEVDRKTIVFTSELKGSDLL